MKAIVNTAADRLTLEELPMPEPGPGQVRIRTVTCGICATDLEIISNTNRTPYGSIPGHEWSGIVDKAGSDVDEGLEGQPCVAENILSDGGEVGFEHPGGYAQYFITEASRLYVLPKAFSLDLAALIEPLAVTVRALSRLREDCQDPIVVFGDGPIGLLAVQLLHRRGHKQIHLVGGREERLQLARQWGAASIINYHDYCEDFSSIIEKRLPSPARSVIEASGNSTALTCALAVTADQGRILIVGDYGKQQSSFLWNHLLHREYEIIASNASKDAWPEAVSLAMNKDLELAPLITHTIVAEKFEQAIELVRGRQHHAIKVLLNWT